MKTLRQTLWTTVLFAGVLALAVTSPVAADQVILDDLIVDGSACIGFDCVNGESFGFDTLRLKENNLRIKFQDTSASASFPTNDWQLTANDSANGGANKFSVDDIDGGRTPFTIEASAPSHSLYVDDAGRIGLGTNSPVVELHVVDGDTPTLRLEQDGSNGFTPQTWDVAGNETNFFIRDATNGSRLPFKIKPSAPTNSIYVDTDGDVGLGTASPNARMHVIGSALIDQTDGGAAEATLHVRRTDGTANLFVEEADASVATRSLMTLENNGRVEFRLTDTSTGSDWTFANGLAAGSIIITKSASGVNEFILEGGGDLTITGGLTTAMNNLPDYVFEDDYELMPLTDLEAFIKENKHLPKVPSASEVEAAGNQVNMTEMQRVLLEKVEELTLYAVDQQRVIAALETRLDELEADSER